MNKCHDIAGYKELAASLLSDLHGLLPTSDLEASRDITRCVSLVENRGLGWLTLTLPEAGKALDAALAKGRLDKLALPGFRPVGGNVSSIIPSFMKEIWLRVFDEFGLLREEPCITSIACLRQFLYCFKKARFDCDPERIAATLREFYEVDASLRPPSHYWDGGSFDDRACFDLHISDVSAEHDGSQRTLPGIEPAASCRESLLHTVQFAMDCVATTLGDFNAEEWRAKHGRGAVSDGKLGSFLKYEFPSWSDRLETAFPLSSFGFPNYDAWVQWLSGNSDYPQGSFDPGEKPSRLITVPKTMKGPRLIASEPTSNQYCQQAILDFLVDRTSSTFLSTAIDFKDQRYNQELALSSSHDQMYATVDLSSASDCVSCWLVERAFRRNRPLLKALYAARTAWVSDGVSIPPRFHYLRKYTTQGAATTFPVQSIIYASICAGVLLHDSGAPLNGENLRVAMSSVRVFGDDIIVPKDVVGSLIEVLTYLGFRINPNKTFSEGNFRESCGVDAFDGTDVTPAYILELYDELRPSSIKSVLSVSNNLFLKGLWKTAQALERTLPAGILRGVPVVGVESGVPGRTSFVGSDVSHLKKRWNPKLHRKECRIFSVVDRSKRVPTKGSATLLQYFLEAPDPDTMVTWRSGYDERPGMLVHFGWVDLGLIE